MSHSAFMIWKDKFYWNLAAVTIRMRYIQPIYIRHFVRLFVQLFFVLPYCWYRMQILHKIVIVFMSFTCNRMIVCARVFGCTQVHIIHSYKYAHKQSGCAKAWNTNVARCVRWSWCGGGSGCLLVFLYYENTNQFRVNRTPDMHDTQANHLRRM